MSRKLPDIDTNRPDAVTSRFRFEETLYDAYGQIFEVDEVFFETRSEHQHLIIFHNAMFGRVMALDGVVQTTEADEFVYHEMLAHVPLLAHGSARRVLIVGGGDGGMLREVCRHSTVDRVVMVEIDRSVIELSSRYLPNHSAGAFDDPRLELVIDDGARYVQHSKEKFDVIISDSTDPIGPGEVLFTDTFYAGCKRLLNPGGVLVTQNGVAFMQLDELRNTVRRLAPLFSDCTFYSAAIPTYVGGIMAFAWASDDPGLRQQDRETIRSRYAAAGLDTRFYTPDLHRASFGLPKYVQDAIQQAAEHGAA